MYNFITTSPAMDISFFAIAVAMVSSWFALLILFIPLFLLPGTILGWVAAARIRQSDGQLYGMRLAAIGALSPGR